MKPKILGLLLTSFTLLSTSAFSQCDPLYSNSHELENASNQTITYTAYVASGSNLCGTPSTITGTLAGCTAVCIVPATGEWVVAMEVKLGTNTFFDGYPNCYSPSGSPKNTTDCDNRTQSFHLEWVGMNQTVFEP